MIDKRHLVPYIKTKFFGDMKIRKERFSNCICLFIIPVVLLVLLYVVFSPSSALAKVYLDIYSPNIRKIKIAVLPPRWHGNIAPKSITPEIFENRITRDLWITGYFNIISGKEIPDHLKASYLYHDQVNPVRFKRVGAEFILAVSAGISNNNLSIEYHLYDVAMNKEIAAQGLNGSLKTIDRIFHRFENKIIYYITGSDGVFDTKLAFVSTRTGNKEIYTIDFDGRHLRRVTRNGSINLSPKWSPNGQKISFTSFIRRNPDLYVIDFIRGKIRLLSHQTGLNAAPAWSPDGHHIALTMRTRTGSEIFLVNTKGKKIRRLTKSRRDDLSASWSPDGRKIAFVSNRSGRPQIYTMNADGSGVKRLTFRGTYNVSPAWSPRGDRIVYSGIIDGKFQICTVSLDGQAIHVLTSIGNNQSPSWSPDGRYIAYSQATRRGTKIYVMNFDGNFKRQVSRGGGKDSSPSWSPHLEKP
jgi:TolB protein